MEKSVVRRGRSRNRNDRAPFRREHDGPHYRRTECDLGQWCNDGEGAPLGVGTAAARQVDVTGIGRLADAMGVVQQRVEVGQRKAAPDEESGEEQRNQTVRPAITHATSLESRPSFVYGFPER
jgi:hypothetical protein